MPHWHNPDQLELMRRLQGMYASWQHEDVVELSEDEYQQEVWKHKCDIETRWKDTLHRKKTKNAY